MCFLSAPRASATRVFNASSPQQLSCLVTRFDLLMEAMRCLQTCGHAVFDTSPETCAYFTLPAIDAAMLAANMILDDAALIQIDVQVTSNDTGAAAQQQCECCHWRRATDHGRRLYHRHRIRAGGDDQRAPTGPASPDHCVADTVYPALFRPPPNPQPPWLPLALPKPGLSLQAWPPLLVSRI